jgi:hypothetical protein
MTGNGRNNARHGSTYMLILGLSLIVTVLALGAIAAVRARSRASLGMEHVAEARLYAHAAIEIGRLRIATQPSWRTSFPNGVWGADAPVGSGTYTLEGIDPGDSDLTDDDTDPVVLIGTGAKGPARQKMQVTLVPVVRGLTCLAAALHAGDDLTVNGSGDTINAGGDLVSTNGKLSNSGTIDGDVDAQSVQGSGTITGTTTAPAPVKEMPDGTVFDYYIANGTPINVTSIPLSAGFRSMEAQVLSPAVNPWGTHATNPEGIYVIDCQGQKVAITNCRIVGTLVLLNAGGVSEVYTVNWEAAVENYPALMVQGNMDFYVNSGNLLEEGPPLRFNFNPVGTPYLGVQDGDTADTYPVVIKGLVYVSGDVDTWQSPDFRGVVVVGNVLSATGDMSLTYQSTFLNNPPPGFLAPAGMKISPGSWKQVVD